MNFESFLVGLVVGLLVGGLFVIYATAPRKEAQSQPASTATMADMLNTQIAYQQSQNMLRQLQLEAARQESEMRQLEEKRLQFVADASRLNQYDLRKALEAMGDRS